MTIEALTNELRRLEAEGRYSELRTAATAALSVVSLADVENVARLNLFISRSVFESIKTPDDWKLALRHARTALEFAPEGSVLRFVALQRCASMCVDLGKFELARRYALAFMWGEDARSDELKPWTAYVQRDLGSIAYNERRFDSAAKLYRKALALFDGNVEETCRTALNVAWALLRAGRMSAARQALPSIVPDSMTALYNSALAAILADEGRLDEAIALGREALAGSRGHFDFADGAELALVLATASRKLRQLGDYLAFLHTAVEFASRQGGGSVKALLARLFGQLGGETPDEAYRGTADLRTRYGACFTSGVA